MHIRRWTHTTPMLRQSSQPGALGVTGLMASRWTQRSGWSGSNLTSIVVLIRAVAAVPPGADGPAGWSAFASRECGISEGELPVGGGLDMRQRAVEQLSAGLDAELSEHAAEVVVDGRRADVQLGGGFRVRRALGDEPGDLPLPGREVAAGLDRASSRGLSGGGQLGTGALGERGA